MILKHLNEEVVNFDGRPEVYEVVNDTATFWTLSHIIRTLMKNLAKDEEHSFEDRVLASNIGVRLRDTDDKEVEISESEFNLIKSTGENHCHPVLLELFNKAIRDCK